MNSVAASVRLPAPVRAPSRRRRVVVVAALVVVLLLAAAGAAYFVVDRQRAESARRADIALARARAVASAQARGVPVSAKAVAAVKAAAKAAAPTSARVAEATRAADLFGVHSWYVPPPPPPPPPPVAYVPPPPPPAPVAPPLPFVYLGSYVPGDDAAVYFLTRGDRVYDVKVGDTVDGTYLVESAGNGQLIFNYTPLNQKQSLATGIPQ